MAEGSVAGFYKKGTFIYAGVMLFCMAFSLIYNHFSHGVHSPYMTWLFAPPLVLGVLPGLVLWGVAKARPCRFCLNSWNSGVAAITAGSCLRGIFEIAGTSSVYQGWLIAAGAVMLAAAVAVCMFGILRGMWSEGKIKN
jgi:hypothetical protein